MSILSSSVGLGLGVIIGIITGTFFVSILRSIVQATTFTASMAVATKLVGIPAFMFGGPWVATLTLKSVNWSDVAPWYVPALAIVFSAIAIFPVFRFIGRMGDGFKTDTGRKEEIHA